MSKNKQLIQTIVAEMSNGTPVTYVANEYKIPLSTLYYWRAKYETVRSRRNQITMREVKDLERRYNELKQIFDTVVSSPFIQDVSLQDREAYMAKLEETNGISAHILCKAFSVHHTTYHHYLYDNRKEKAWFVKRREEIEQLVLSIFVENGGTYGARRIYSILRNVHNRNVSLEYVRKIMRENGIRGAKPSRIKRGANAKYKEYRSKRNILKQDFVANNPNTKWVLDCKMIYGKNKVFQICVIEDLFARRVVAYRIGSSECGRLVAATIKTAAETRKREGKIILHTDNSKANTSIRVERLIRELGITHSYPMTSNPQDNSPIESFFSHFSTEFLKDAYSVHPFRSIREMYERIDKYIHHYNYVRPHEYNNGLPPVVKETRHRLSYEPKANKTTSDK